MRKLFALYRKNKEVINYIIVGGLTTFISLAVYYILVLTVLNPESAVQLQCANVVSWTAAVSFAYVTNRKYVFESTASDRLREASAFFGSRVTTLLLEMAGMFLAVSVLGFNDKIGKLLIQFVVMVSNYILSKYLVFRKGEKTKKVRKRRETGYWLLYTGVFVFMILMVFSFFILSGRTLVKRLDAWTQHYKALIYYSRWLRSIAVNLLEHHSLAVPAYSFSMGYGSDIMTTLHYYVHGDPLNLFSVFVPVKYMYHFYGGLILLRLYLAGVSFSHFCFYRKRGKAATLAGAFVYVFCGFSLCCGLINPYFINPLIYLPMLLLGVDKILEEKKAVLFIGSVFLSAISNFYFFYMLALLTAMYTLFRLAMRYKKTEIREAVRILLHIAGYAVIGVLMSAFVLLPVLIAFSDSPRIGVAVYDFWPSLGYLRDLPESFLTYRDANRWTFMGYSAAAVVIVVFLFMRRGNRHLKFLFALSGLCLIFPLAGHIFNGFSYVSNRWIFSYSLLIAYIVTAVWPSLKTVTRREWFRLSGLSGAYLILCVVLSGTVRRNMLVSGVVVCLFLAALLIQPQGRKRPAVPAVRLPCLQVCLTEALLFGVVLLGIYGNAYCYFSEHSRNMVSQFKRQEAINEELYDIVDQAVLSVEDDQQMYRYSGHAYDVNTSVLSDLCNLDYFWSLSPGSFFEWWTQMALLENTHDYYHTMDDRTVLNTLSGVKYFTTEAEEGQEKYVPYGYSQIEIKDERAAKKYRLYENEYTLPLGYVYRDYIPADTLAELTPLERQEAILQGAALEEQPEMCKKAEFELTSVPVNYELDYKEGAIAVREDALVIQEENAALTLHFDGMEQAETYLYIKGFDYHKEELSLHDILYQTEPNTLEMEFLAEDADGSVSHKNLTYRTAKETYTTGRHDFLVHLGYSDTKKTSVTILFPLTGVCTLESLEVFCQPMDRYAEQVSALRENTLEHIDMHYLPVENAPSVTGRVTGDIVMNESGILCITIPYSSGWTAYVDGEKQPLLHTNIMFMGLELAEGSHDLELVYVTPGVSYGILLSLAGTAALLAVIWTERRRKQG